MASASTGHQITYTIAAEPPIIEAPQGQQTEFVSDVPHQLLLAHHEHSWLIIFDINEKTATYNMMPNFYCDSIDRNQRLSDYLENGWHVVGCM